MNIMKLIQERSQNNAGREGVTIAFLGDSVTQGCFEVYMTAAGEVETVYDRNYTYHSYLSRIFSLLYPNVPVNIINAGISGGSAPHAVDRLERDVLRHQPDLTIVCFGLNDAGAGMNGIDEYVQALEKIFVGLKASGSEIIFMTPNMMNTYVSVFLTDPDIREIAETTQRTQNEGILDAYLEAAVLLCKKHNVPVCDCYAKWKRLANQGVDTTNLLSNKINHPTREMNWLFAVSLLDTIMGEA